MLYFTPKHDLKSVEQLFQKEQDLLGAYHEVVQFAQAKQLHSFPTNVLPQNLQDEFFKLRQRYSELRRQVSEQTHPFAALTDRYKAVDATEYFLECTKLPNYAESRPTYFTSEDHVYWVDKMHALQGAVKAERDKQFWHLVNPFYWIYALFHSLFNHSGVTKALGEQVSKAISKILTVGVTAASPWIKDLVVKWFKHLMQ